MPTRAGPRDRNGRRPVPAPAPPDDAAACPAPGLQTCVVTVACDRRRALAVLAGLCAASVPVATWAADQENRFLRIGTGNVNGTYYQIGGLLADIVSNPPGSRPCDRGGSCGVPGLIAIAQSSSGSVANVEAIEQGEVETGGAERRRLLCGHGHGPVRRPAAGHAPAGAGEPLVRACAPGRARRCRDRRRDLRCAASGSRWMRKAQGRWSTRGSSSRPSGSPRASSTSPTPRSGPRSTG